MTDSRTILHVTVALCTNTSSGIKIEIGYNREGKESYIGDFKCVLGNYVDSLFIDDNLKSENCNIELN